MAERRDDDARTVAATPRLDSTLPAELRVLVTSGEDRGISVPLAQGRPVVVGKGEDADLRLADAQVSRRHLELAIEGQGITARDLGSLNGSFFEGARFERLRVGVGAVLRLGETELRVEAATTPAAGPTSFGGLVAASASMRALFATLERIARSDAAVLVQGETGTGKELIAEALHHASPRAGGPFVICDLGGVTASLIESELFGHVRGAFTGAERDRDGAFKLADRGTIFLDEVGELSLELQPRLLRVLERRQIKPVGASLYKDLDVRVIAATNRDLQAEIRAGQFRADLFHRLAVVEVRVPPLRERREDIPLLVEHVIGRLARDPSRPPPRLSPEALAALVAHDWPGNVRELRNVLERALAVSGDAGRIDARVFGLPGSGRGASQPAAPTGDGDVSFKEAKERLVGAWEREYLSDLLRNAEGNVTLAARRAGLARAYLHALLNKHGLARED